MTAIVKAAIGAWSDLIQIGVRRAMWYWFITAKLVQEIKGARCRSHTPDGLPNVLGFGFCVITNFGIVLSKVGCGGSCRVMWKLLLSYLLYAWTLEVDSLLEMVVFIWVWAAVKRYKARNENNVGVARCDVKFKHTDKGSGIYKLCEVLLNTKSCVKIPKDT
jgi:hypothetical protein